MYMVSRQNYAKQVQPFKVLVRKNYKEKEEKEEKRKREREGEEEKASKKVQEKGIKAGTRFNGSN